MKVLITSIHNLNNDTVTVEKKFITEDSTEFITSLHNDIFENENKRTFNFTSGSGEIVTNVNRIITNTASIDFEKIYEEVTDVIARRLVKSESDSIARYPGIGKPKAGSLITSLIEDKFAFVLLIAKVETEEYLTEDDLSKARGWPYLKKTLKSGTITFPKNVAHEEFTIQESSLANRLSITDSGNKISKYWSGDFFEAEEATSDQTNTFDAFVEIDKLLSRNLKSIPGNDYVETRNNLIGYFTTQEDFNFTEMVEYVIGHRDFSNAAITPERIKSEFTNLSTSNKFDTNFKIIKEEVKSKIKKTYKVNENIEIRMNGHIQELRHMIKAVELPDGKKVIQITVEDNRIFDSFK
ncbi:nucleoid-associated protein [Chryseomicrobium palamuruense]